MKDRQEAIKAKVSDLLDQTFSIMKIPMNSALENLMSKMKDTEEVKEVKIEYDIGGCSDYKKSDIVMSERDLLMQNLYSLELTNSLQDG